MGEKGSKVHAIMISVPFQGHINPFVNLALNLASKGLTITFVHLEFVHNQLSKAHHHANQSTSLDLFSDARESGLDIRYTTMSDGLPQEFDRNDAANYWISLFHNLPARVDQFVGNMIQSEPLLVPNVFITDTIYAWSDNIARKYNLVHVSFWTEPALVFSLLYHLDLLREKGHFLCKDNQDLEIDYVPGVQSISTKDMMTSLTDEDDITSFSLFAAFEEVKKADFVLHNTVYELESETLSALNKYQPTYAVGPINFSSINNTVSQSMKAESDCTEWLESRPPGSVLYISFGSVVQTSKQVIQEIAHGLLLSGVSFIWVARAGITGTDDGGVLPDGFEDEIKDRGLIIPWCDQIRVLSNPGVGGFLTHCGWNSIVESMWCGVPMICYPVAYDQPTNRKLVVDDWKIGISLCDGPLLDRKDVAERIKSFMNGDISERLRQEAKNVKHTLRNALEIDGSSYRNVDQFMKDLEKKLLLEFCNTNVF